jgi:hypothetical protein
VETLGTGRLLVAVAVGVRTVRLITNAVRRVRIFFFIGSPFESFILHGGDVVNTNHL